MESAMQETPLQIRVERANQHTDQFILSSSSFHYPIIINLEAAITFSSDRLRQLHLIWSNPSDQTYSFTLFCEISRDIGMWLWRTLLPESAPVQERRMLEQALCTGRGPLLLVLPDSLAELPWELLYDPQYVDGQGFLACRRPFVRLNDGIAETPLLLIEPPLRVLLLLASPPVPGESTPIDVESIRADVEEAVYEMRKAGFLHLLIEDLVTPRQVEHHLVHFRPHIIHYIGHGEYDQVDGGRILWEDEQGKELWLPAKSMAGFLRSRDLIAVVLHACETARSNARAEVASLASILAQAGLPAILAQQANFTYKSTPLASQAWYEELRAGKDMASALLAVRQALIQEDRLDWAVPILQGNQTSLVPVLDRKAAHGPADPRLINMEAITDPSTPSNVFVGRHRELRALRLLLEDTSDRVPVLAIITGPGGIGKSTLVAQAIRRYAGLYKATLRLSCRKGQGSDLFPPTERLLIEIEAFLKHSGMSGLFAEREENVLPLNIKARINRAVLAFNAVGPVLLIIENLENLQNDDQMISDQDFLYLLRAFLTHLQGGRVLVTGRFLMKELQGKETFETRFLHLPLDELSPDETQHLWLHYPQFNLLENNLVKAFGKLPGLPYVYSLLDSKFARENLGQILYKVHEYTPGQSVKVLIPGRAAEESQKIRSEVVALATLETFVQRLSEASRTLLAQLSVLQRPFPLGAMEEGLRAAQTTWQPLLDWSLLHYEPLEQTYHLYSITRRYAEDLLNELRPPSPYARLAAWYESYADHGSHALEDYLEAHDLWKAAGNHQRAGELVVTKLAEILSRSGRYPKLRELSKETQEAMPQIVKDTNKEMPEFRAALEEAFQQTIAGMSDELLNSPGNGLVAWITRWITRRQLSKIVKQAEKFQREGSQDLQAQAFGQSGAIAQMEGNYSEARRCYEESQKIFKQLGNHDGQATTLHLLGNVDYLLGDYKNAHRNYKRSLALFRRVRSKWTAPRLDILEKRAGVLNDWGILASSQGHYRKARQLCKRSLTIFALLDYMEWDKNDRSSIWTAEAALDRTAALTALADLATATYVALRAELPKVWWIVQWFCMPILAILKRLDTQDGQLPAFLEKVNAQDRQAATFHLLGNIAYARRNYLEARQLYQWSLDICKRVGNKAEQATIFHSLGNATYSQRNYPEAREFYEQSLTLKESLGDKVGQAQSLGQLGMIAQKQRSYEEAREFYEQGLDLFIDAGNKDGIATTLGQLGMLAYERKNYEQALENLIKAYFLFEDLHSPYCILALRGMARIRRIMNETTFVTLCSTISESEGCPFPALPDDSERWDNPGEDLFSMLPDDLQRAQRNREIQVVEAVYTPYLTLSRLPQILSRSRKKKNRRKKS